MIPPSKPIPMNQKLSDRRDSIKGETVRVSDELIDEVERVAKAATPVGWSAAMYFPGDHEVVRSDDQGTICDRCSKADAAHIARMDPPTALALVARIRAAEATKNEGHDIVARIWRHLGSPTKEELKGPTMVLKLREKGAAHK